MLWHVAEHRIAKERTHTQNLCPLLVSGTPSCLQRHPLAALCRGLLGLRLRQLTMVPCRASALLHYRLSRCRECRGWLQQWVFLTHHGAVLLHISSCGSPPGILPCREQRWCHLLLHHHFCLGCHLIPCIPCNILLPWLEMRLEPLQGVWCRWLASAYHPPEGLASMGIRASFQPQILRAKTVVDLFAQRLAQANVRAG
jgi:hypothetical protein